MCGLCGYAIFDTMQYGHEVILWFLLLNNYFYWWLINVYTKPCLERSEDVLIEKNSGTGDITTYGTCTDSHAFEDESLNQLYDAIRVLSEVDRAVILLYLEEKSYQEIADIIGTNPNNIGVRIKRIKARLKKILTQNK